LRIRDTLLAKQSSDKWPRWPHQLQVLRMPFLKILELKSNQSQNLFSKHPFSTTAIHCSFFANQFFRHQHLLLLASSSSYSCFFD
jgi:hypothetical protein